MNINFNTRYQKVLTQFHQVPPKMTKQYKFFLAGFVEGEGSLCVSIKKTGKRIKADPEFNIAQHKSGIIHLIAFMDLFKTGNIYFKSGSQHTYVYKITNRQALKEKFIPYYKQYVWPYACESKRFTFKLMVQLLDLFEQKVHLNPKKFGLQILPLVYQMNTAKGKTRKWSLQELQAKIKAFE
uniref:Homing endonuclease LAGLIDADG domain-containing protein n=1 Tax=Halimeda discoidea TaxID=118222 RepID=A0A1C9JB61_9CHLO|nr:hypothetical protein [Halimeda discoidea]